MILGLFFRFTSISSSKTFSEVVSLKLFSTEAISFLDSSEL